MGTKSAFKSFIFFHIAGVPYSIWGAPDIILNNYQSKREDRTSLSFFFPSILHLTFIQLPPFLQTLVATQSSIYPFWSSKTSNWETNYIFLLHTHPPFYWTSWRLVLNTPSPMSFPPLLPITKLFLKYFSRTNKWPQPPVFLDLSSKQQYSKVKWLMT